MAFPTVTETQAKQEIFAKEYAEHRNGILARQRAGYSDGYPHTALLKKPYVARRIREIWGHAFEDAEVTAADVIREISRCAFADIRDVYDASGNLLPPHMLNDDIAATIASIDSEVRWEGKGDDAVPVITKKIRRVDKMAALNLLAKHFKIVGDDGDGVNALATALADKLREGRRRAAGQPAYDTQDATDATIIERPASAAVEVRPQVIDSTPLENEDDPWL